MRNATIQEKLTLQPLLHSTGACLASDPTPQCYAAVGLEHHRTVYLKLSRICSKDTILVACSLVRLNAMRRTERRQDYRKV